MIRSFIALLLALVLFSACTEQAFFKSSVEPSGASWTYDEPLAFNFEIEDTLARYDFYLDVEHLTDYPFQNLYVKIITEHPQTAPQEDIVSLELANKLGLWEGKCANEQCKIRIPLQTNARFNQIG
ncbi:MAG: gliding motility lipoprotein GldH, partial [Bacteroidota bacterium]